MTTQTSPVKIKKNSLIVVRANTTMWRDATPEDYQKWANSPHSKGMNDAGETKLDSPSRYRKSDGQSYRVVRSRCRCRRGWSQVGKCCEVVDNNGVHWFVQRHDVFVVSEK